MLHRSAVKDYDARVICYYRLLYIDFASLSSGIYYFDSQVCLIEIREMWLLCPGIMKPALFQSLTFESSGISMQANLKMSKSNRWLRGLLLSVCVLIAGCGRAHDPNSKEATEYVLKLGGTVIPVHSELPIDTAAKIPEGNFAIREIDLTNAKFKNIDLVKLSNLPYLESLNLHRTNLTDKGLSLITDLPKLQSLEIAYTRVTDAEISKLTRFPRLRKIFLYGTPAKPQTLEDLKSNLKGCIIYK